MHRIMEMRDENTPCFTLRLEQGQDVSLPDGALDVPNDRALGLIHEFDANLGDTTTGASAAKNLQYSTP